MLGLRSFGGVGDFVYLCGKITLDMKILHTADLHIGQTLYQQYERRDEHDHFFSQLQQWCEQEQPDALLVSGDVFDVQNPGAEAIQAYTDYFVDLHTACPRMRIIITAGNHDSPSRLQSNRRVWAIANVQIVGIAPSTDYLSRPAGWQSEFVVELPTGIVVALPHLKCSHERYPELLQSILDFVAEINSDNRPVVMMAHTAVTGLDIQGHNFDIGTIRTVGLDCMGSGYDYLALGHIHKPQTLQHLDDCFRPAVEYPAPVARYSGSALHVSCDETYPHSVSKVEIDRHGGTVRIEQLRIDQLRHFHILPESGAFADERAAIDGLQAFMAGGGQGYFRFRLNADVNLAADFDSKVYDLIENGSATGCDLRYNPKAIRVGAPAVAQNDEQAPLIAICDLQQMANPMEFILQTLNQYEGFDADEVREVFAELEEKLDNQNL